VEKPDGQRHLARPRLSWEDNIKLDLGTLSGLGRGDVVNMQVNVRVSEK
jgi:hypothetical protein